MESNPRVLKVPELTIENYEILKKTIEKNKDIQIYDVDSTEFVRTRPDGLDPTNWKQIEYIALYPKISTMSPDRLDYLLMSILPIELNAAWNLSNTKTESNGYVHFPKTTFIYNPKIAVTETINSFQNLMKQEQNVNLKINETASKKLVHVRMYPSKEIANAVYNHGFPKLSQEEIKKLDLKPISEYSAKAQIIAEYISLFSQNESR
jgi:hypothetical protein